METVWSGCNARSEGLLSSVRNMTGCLLWKLCQIQKLNIELKEDCGKAVVDDYYKNDGPQTLSHLA